MAKSAGYVIGMSVHQQLRELAGSHEYCVVILPGRTGEEMLGTLRCLRGQRVDLVGFGSTPDAVAAVLLERLKLRALFEDRSLRGCDSAGVTIPTVLGVPSMKHPVDLPFPDTAARASSDAAAAPVADPDPILG